MTCLHSFLHSPEVFPFSHRPLSLPSMMSSSLSSSNTSLAPPFFHNSFFYLQFSECSEFAYQSSVFTAFIYTSVFTLLPLSVLILCEAIQRWWKQRHMSMPNRVNPSELITYNTVVLELIGLLAFGCYSYGMYTYKGKIMRAAILLLFVVYLGRLLFQCLNCVERYLAVIHPVIYLSLKTERGIMVRHGIMGCIWLLCLGMLLLLLLLSQDVPTIPFFMIFAVGLLVISFCTISVLCALIHPGPGDVSGDKKKVHQTKKTAFFNIAVITVVLFVKYIGLLVCTALHASSSLKSWDGCAALLSSFWFCLPSSLAMPLMFLCKGGKLQCFQS